VKEENEEKEEGGREDLIVRSVMTINLFNLSDCCFEKATLFPFPCPFLMPGEGSKLFNHLSGEKSGSFTIYPSNPVLSTNKSKKKTKTKMKEK